MTTHDFISLLPLFIPFISSVILMLSIAWRRSHTLVATISGAGLLLAFMSTFFNNYSQNLKLIEINNQNIFILKILLLTGLILIIYSYEYFQKYNYSEEFYILLVLGVTGSLVVATAINFLALFLGLELISIAMYGAIAYKLSDKNIKAAIKYIILAALAGALLLFGMALIYASSKTLNFLELRQSTSLLFTAGITLIFIALAFKMSIAPFHLWTPDVYEGSPLPITAFLATISKASALIVATRLWLIIQEHAPLKVKWLLIIGALLSMLIGTILALYQQNIKRFLAYSSIAHFGYLIMALISSDSHSQQVILLYLTAYIITILIIFGVLINLPENTHSISDLKSLFYHEKYFAFILLLALFSLMGMPLTALFIAKFFVVMASVKNAQWLLILGLIISSTISIFGYMRIANTMIEKTQLSQSLVRTKPVILYTIILLAFCLVIVGIWPVSLTMLLP
jgi:NADH-quinone oxidoreductase subunit N